MRAVKQLFIKLFLLENIQMISIYHKEIPYRLVDNVFDDVCVSIFPFCDFLASFEKVLKEFFVLYIYNCRYLQTILSVKMLSESLIYMNLYIYNYRYLQTNLSVKMLSESLTYMKLFWLFSKESTKLNSPAYHLSI